MTEPDNRTVVQVVVETDGYTSAVAGVTVEGIRVGGGVGPNVVLAIPGEPLTVTSSCYGFAMSLVRSTGATRLGRRVPARSRARCDQPPRAAVHVREHRTGTTDGSRRPSRCRESTPAYQATARNPAVAGGRQCRGGAEPADPSDAAR
jgi:hypothetical protein